MGGVSWGSRASRGHGKASGLDLAELDTRGAVVYHVHDGRLTKIVGYYDRDRALADLGLEEQAV
jgi:ketosteroid isomerase-like protein